jgi:6,7-dimethyl-8-ribityllumazine synthase
MASALHNLSDYDFASVPDASDMKFGIVVSEWNSKITGALLQGAFDTLTLHGAKEENITVKTVPGSFELIFGSAAFVNSCKVDAVIAIGCVIKGDTPHFDYICQGTTQGLSELNASGNIPVIYGLLTCNTMEQAEERCGGMLGNKGDECAVTAIKMVDYKRSLTDYQF